MKIFITGVLGFIGSNLAEDFLKKGHLVYGLDNCSGSYPTSYFNRNLLELSSYGSFSYFNFDILNKFKLNSFFSEFKPDILLHCAAKTNVRASKGNLEEYCQINVEGTKNILEVLYENSPQTKVILFSSSSVYGNNMPPFSENMSMKPISPYGVSKAKMEDYVLKYSLKKKLKSIIVRPFSVYGKRARYDMLPMILYQALTKQVEFIKYGSNLSNVRDWTHIGQVVNIISFLMTMDDIFSSHEIFNIGAGKPIGIDDFITSFKSIFKRYFVLEGQLIIKQKSIDRIEMPMTFADATKIHKYFGKYLSFPLEKGFGDLFKYLISGSNSLK